MAKGIVVEKMYVLVYTVFCLHVFVNVQMRLLAGTCSGIEAKQPNSAIRKCCRVQVCQHILNSQATMFHFSRTCYASDCNFAGIIDCPAHQERQEDRCVRSKGRLSELH